MNKRAAIMVMLFTSASFLARAQLGEEPKLSEPVLKRAPSKAEWTVEFRQDRSKTQETIEKRGVVSGDGNTSEGIKPQALLTVSKDGQTYREVLRSSDGRVTEKWALNGLQIYESPQSGQLARAILPPSQYSSTYSDYRRSDFEELEWIGKDNFQGVKEVGGRKVFEFRVDAAKRRLTPRERSELVDADTLVTAENVSSAPGPGFTAYLDMTTQRPLYFDDGQVVRIYKFSERPPASLVIPERFAAEFRAWKNELSRRGPLPPP